MRAFAAIGKQVSIKSHIIPTNDREQFGKGDFRHEIFEAGPNGKLYSHDEPTYVHETENKFSRMTVKDGKYKIQLTGCVLLSVAAAGLPPPPSCLTNLFISLSLSLSHQRYGGKRVDSWIFTFQAPHVMRSYEMNDTEFQRHLGALKGKLKDDVLTYQTAQGSANEHMDVEALIEEMEEAAGELDVKLRDYGWVLVLRFST